jgi:thiamine biosynthesis lipoprotein
MRALGERLALRTRAGGSWVIRYALLMLSLGLVSCRSVSKPAPAPPLVRYEYERPEMGVPFRITLYAPDQAQAERAVEAAFGRVKELNDIMTDYDADSELSKLSHTSGQGRRVAVSPDLWFVLERAQAMSRRSDGAFDVTVGPCVNLWRRARRQHELPDPQRLAQARKAVGYRLVRLYPKTHEVELLAPDMRLDLGGIAKGYAADQALRALEAQGVTRALIEGGGDMVVGDPPPGKPAWRILLASLDVSNAPPDRFLLLKNAAISTSSDLYQRLEINGVRYSHIVDPRTGIGLTNHSLVNVVAPRGITADSLTKVVCVLGPEPGLKVVEATRGAAARLMRAPGGKLETYESSRFKRYYGPPGQ